ncbi:acyl-CoA oxidase [Lentinula raphanica]|uniref:Acyl-CoA oxidase n=1 Tax=Lentinula raphanica TaxID=153919 RepID=A0AA38PJI8_9AGAR|nr:acyl-CoA oxidase [Lentinula raphanica]KAJ3821482.1 acyl-CoA oxidase [Lentinula raphanica]KAJ3844118.1 acyl-CoA oxidase [Lentinula raphanica]KAJ3975646.1 acyl-CoA oxidase [Lentinula raphanica]
MRSNSLHNHPLFKIRNELLSKDESVSLAYKRARLVVQTYGLSATDVEHCSPKFWSMMLDPICSLDIAMFTILAAHVGLTIGTLSRHLRRRPDLLPLVNRLLRFDTVGIYLLTERGHGLDAFNIETTATKTSDGFILHTPREEATKFMPASTPAFGIPKVALVNAKMIVDGEDRGARFFIVPICNEREMCRGVISTRLPTRSGTNPLDFSITQFDNVWLPPTALVASDISDFSLPERPLEAWWDEVWRIQLGTMAVPAPWINALKATAFIGGRYSMHRTIIGKGANVMIPIISFRTQQWPVLNATAVAMVMNTWFPRSIQFAMADNTDHRVRHAMSVIVKATVCRHFQRCVPEMAERCGAQGTFEHNYMAKIENDGKGVIIAEGDILTLCIRLFSELLLGRYTIPMPSSSDSILARHAWGLLEENRELLRSVGDHRSESFNSLVLPQSQAVIEAIGHAMAYAAAQEAKLPQPILDIYECSVIRQDPAWYSENAGLNRMAQRLREDVVITAALPELGTYLDALQIEDYVSAPIVSDAGWKEYVASLPRYTGNAITESQPEIQHIRAVL